MVDAPQRLEGEATTAFLSRVLAEHGAPGHMVSLAAEGHYDDYKSPLATPCIQLLADLRAEGLNQLAEWHMDGVFDATRAESDAWAKSPEGQAVFRELTKPRPNREQRRRQQRGR